MLCLGVCIAECDVASQQFKCIAHGKERLQIKGNGTKAFLDSLTSQLSIFILAMASIIHLFRFTRVWTC